MFVSNIEQINTTFKLPISYNNDKKSINENITKDLELIETLDPSGTPMYSYAFNPTTNFGETVLKQFPLYYTTDVTFLKETQTLLKTYKPFKKEDPDDIFSPDFVHIMKIWDEIKNDSGFKDKYNYLDWKIFEFLNNSDLFLQIMSMYNLSSPVISFIIPIIILIIPFFIIKMKGVKLSVPEYISILKIIASGNAVGKIFFNFNSVNLEEKIYLILSFLFYIFSIYQNILTCIRFNDNMKKIHIYLNDFKQYITYTEKSMENLLVYTSNLKTYKEFNEKLKENKDLLVKFKTQIEEISPYNLSFKKILSFGYVLKCFYELYNSTEYNDCFLYSFGFNGYIDNIEGIINNIKEKHINFAKISSNKKKKNKKQKAIFKNSYYPAIMNNNPIKNDINLTNNNIITGPNASGKTTILKSSLINVIITQQFGCGFYSSAQLKPYNFIHCYLNIPDTSGRDSLFQAEARRCKDILDIIEKNKKATHFCVFDELYSGTNPDDAVMSAVAFMNYLIKVDSVNCMLTTHFIELCNQLDKNKKFKNVRNVHSKLLHTQIPKTKTN